MQRLEVSGAVRPIYGSLGVKRLSNIQFSRWDNLRGHCVLVYFASKCLDRPRGFQEIKVPRFHDNGTGWW